MLSDGGGVLGPCLEWVLEPLLAWLEDLLSVEVE